MNQNYIHMENKLHRRGSGLAAAPNLSVARAQNCPYKNYHSTLKYEHIFRSLPQQKNIFTECFPKYFIK